MTEIDKKARAIVNDRFTNNCDYCQYAYIKGFDCDKEKVSCYDGIKLYLESKEEKIKDDIE